MKYENIVSLTTRDELNFQFVFTRSLLVDTVVATTASAAVLRVNGKPSPFVTEKPIFVVSLPQSHDLQIHRRHISSRMKTTEIDMKVTYRVRFVVWINDSSRSTSLAKFKFGQFFMKC